MALCECLSACPFFHDKMDNMPSMANLLKKKFCKGDNTRCARYLIFKTLGKEKVPSDLFPTQIERANDLLNQH